MNKKAISSNIANFRNKLFGLHSICEYYLNLEESKETEKKDVFYIKGKLEERFVDTTTKGPVLLYIRPNEVFMRMKLEDEDLKDVRKSLKDNLT